MLLFIGTQFRSLYPATHTHTHTHTHGCIVFLGRWHQLHQVAPSGTNSRIKQWNESITQFLMSALNRFMVASTTWHAASSLLAYTDGHGLNSS